MSEDRTTVRLDAADKEAVKKLQAAYGARGVTLSQAAAIKVMLRAYAKEAEQLGAWDKVLG